MRHYVKPSAELIKFDNKMNAAAVSGTCRCYLDIGVANDYGVVGSGCWTDSEDASAYDMHDAPITG